MTKLITLLGLLLLGVNSFAAQKLSSGVYDDVAAIPFSIKEKEISRTAIFTLLPQAKINGEYVNVEHLTIESVEDYEKIFGLLSPEEIYYSLTPQEMARVYLQQSVLDFFKNGGTQLDLIGVKSLTKKDYIESIKRSKSIGDLNILLTPGLVELDHDLAIYVNRFLIREAGRRGNAMVIIDSPNTKNIDDIISFRRKFMSSNGVMYSSWLKYHIGMRATPPSAAIAGLYAYHESENNIWKAPAGLEAQIRGVTSLSTTWNHIEIDELIINNINPIRNIVGKVSVWGAKTLSRNASEYKFVPVKRLAQKIETSIKVSLKPLAFEPNDQVTWASVKHAVANYLASLHRQGAFQGETATQAYFVRCGRGETMTEDDIANGRLKVQIGFAAIKPAEFIINNIMLRMTPSK
jgi:hypothetical protein